MIYLLYKNDTSKRIKDMELIGVYLDVTQVPKIKDTILTYIITK